MDAEEAGGYPIGDRLLPLKEVQNEKKNIMASSRSRLSAFAGQIAIAGIGDTNYGEEFRNYKTTRLPSTDLLGFGTQAFQSALDDAGMTRADIDGLICCMQFPFERAGETLGMDLRWSGFEIDAVAALNLAINAIQAGSAECIAIIKSTNFKSAATSFGGPQAMSADYVPHYGYYRPWGFTSQGAFDAVVTQRYMELYGLSHRELGAVAVAQRAWARLNPRAIMQAEMNIDDYLASPFICAPFRLPDYCVVCDGGVAMIVTTVDRAKRTASSPLVTIEGLAWAEDNLGNSQLRPKLDLSRKPLHQAAEEVFGMANVGPADIDAFYNYDNFSGELFYTLEGFAYCREGEASRFIQERNIGPGGTFPVNTSGGMLSEAYLQGFNAQTEAIRQVRGQAGPRQIAGCRRAQYVWNTMGRSNSVIYGRA